MKPVGYLTEEEAEEVLSSFWLHDSFYVRSRALVVTALNTDSRVSEFTELNAWNVVNG